METFDLNYLREHAAEISWPELIHKHACTPALNNDVLDEFAEYLNKRYTLYSLSWVLGKCVYMSLDKFMEYKKLLCWPVILRQYSIRSKNVLLWLDDYRDPLDMHTNWTVLSNINMINKRVVWVKSYKEFVYYIRHNGLPGYISFDYDLEDDKHTGQDCAIWLRNYCSSVGMHKPSCSAHSGNEQGRNIIIHELNKLE